MGIPPEKVNDQLVVLYNDGVESVVYATAYTDGQAETAVKACIARYGSWKSARPVLADDHPPK